MSFGDPKSPYDPPQQPQQPPAGGQPGYGTPQQGQPNYGYPPQGQPGYGYPAAPPLQPYGDGGYGGGYGGAPLTMPGTVKAARVMTWVIVALQVLGAGFMFLTAVAIEKAKDDPQLKDDIQFQDLAEFSTGAVYLIAFLALLWAVFAVVLALKFAKGGNGVRIAIMVFAIITAALGIYPFIVIGLVHTVLGVLIAVFVGKSDGGAWFNRPRV
ncbi:hypothetical protein ACFVIM_31245 [Streptomyces sp. NPDC057638]|uniref:hypothetical protein n=1 Tax=Streptomyces sp. NPDC057638 TaxID=3346190 RepID=UPI00367936D4